MIESLLLVATSPPLSSLVPWLIHTPQATACQWGLCLAALWAIWSLPGWVTCTILPGAMVWGPACACGLVTLSTDSHYSILTPPSACCQLRSTLPVVGNWPAWQMKESRVCEGPFPLLQFHNCTALPVPVLMPVRSPRPRIASLALLATSSSRSSHPAEGSWPSECVPCIGPGVPLLGVIGTQSVGDENVLALKDVRGFSSSATW